MDADDKPISLRSVVTGLAVFAALVGGPLGVSLYVYAGDTGPAPGAAPVVPAAANIPPTPPRNPLLPHGDGTRDLHNPNWSTDPTDPFPMPPEWANVRLMEQTADQAAAKSAGCIACHQNVGDPHCKPTLRIGCTDCHGGNATCNVKEQAHVAPRNPHLWPAGGANPARSYTLLNHESPEFIRFMNPGDFRIAHISCGTSGCHPKEVQTNRKQIMATGCMLWGAAAYNNGTLPSKPSLLGEAYGMTGAPLMMKTYPPPTPEEQKKGVIAALYPLPRFEMSQPGNILRIFEPGGRFLPEIGIPERMEEPGRPRTRLSVRGLGTSNRTDPVLVSANKTRLFDPTLNMLGTNDNPGDYRSSGCSSCHVVYANDRSPVHSGPYAKFGNRGHSANPDPTIPRNQPGHPIEHKFTNSIPVSQCMTCHVHPGTTVMNSYIGYMWWDEESEAHLMYPAKQKNPTGEELVRAMLRNPNESAARGHLADPEFTAELTRLNPHMSRVQFGDFHSHGWAFRAVFKRDRYGNLLDHKGAFVGPPTPEKLMAATDWPNKAREFQKEETQKKFADPVAGPAAAVKAEQAHNDCRSGMPVHLMDIHMEKGMHCVDCHFSQDVHGNNRLHMEVRAAVEIGCVDCHGTATDYSKLKTSGPASYTSSPDGKGRNLLALKTPFGRPRFEVQDLGGGRVRVFQNSCVEPGLRWEVVQTRDTVDPTHPRYNAKGALAKTVRWNPKTGQLEWGDMAALEGGAACAAHGNENMSCIACHSSWNPSCFGCHLPQRANVKAPNLHAEGDVGRNYTAYNFQTLRDDVYMLARDGDVTGNKINPARSSCAIHVTSQNGNRETIYIQQQTLSAEGFSGQAFSTNVPHTVRGKGARETKQCTDCHLSRQNDNNAWMSQLLMHGTGFVNFVGKYAWAAAGEEGLFGVAVTESSEPQAVFGTDLHRFAFPDHYRKHVERGGLLEHAHEHPGRDISIGLGRPFKKSEVLMVQNRGEFLYAACGESGVRVFDIAFIDHKGFAERITTAPVSPAGQKFYLPSRYATYVAAPCTPAVDPTRKRMEANKEQPIHPLFGYLYICDKYEGLIVTGAASTLDGNPVNNFLRREVTFNPNGLLCGARHAHVVGTHLYVSCDAGLVVIDIDKPCEPRVVSVTGEPFLKKPKMSATQLRYCYVCDEEGVKVLDITDPGNPRPVSMIRMPEANSVYLARTYAYVAAGSRGLVVLDIARADEPKVDQVFNPGGCMNDVRDIKLGITYTSLIGYVADGKNGMRVVQLTSPDTPGYEGFSPRPTPRLVATFRPHEGKILSIARGLDRDRAVDEAGNQIGVFGRVGARPLNGTEQRKMYLRNGQPWFVSDDPGDSALYQLRRQQR